MAQWKWFGYGKHQREKYGKANECNKSQYITSNKDYRNSTENMFCTKVYYSSYNKIVLKMSTLHKAGILYSGNHVNIWTYFFKTYF